MAKIIELCGSPGVGKSSIFYELEKRRNNDKWITASNTNPYGDKSILDFAKSIFKKVKHRKYARTSITNKSERLYEVLRFVYREIKKGRKFVDLEAMKDAGDRFVGEHPEFIEACWGNIFARQRRSYNGLDLRFEKAEFIYRIIKKKSSFKKKKISNKTIIIDEGFINMIDRGLYKSTTRETERQEIYELLEIMPLPNALVYIETDLNENAKRLFSRAEIRDMHKGLSMAELIDCTKTCRERILTAIKHLENKGMPVLYIDASNPIKESANIIIDFAENFELHAVNNSPEKAMIV
ncbi:hypothetical protein [Gillisia marina]|uniref:hypothetical protein n=1 Tax=Gillisia marina TaxID=1167637 RepID=UPI00029A4BD0|nr:hypothetical protein [Gillisia marina]